MSALWFLESCGCHQEASAIQLEDDQSQRSGKPGTSGITRLMGFDILDGLIPIKLNFLLFNTVTCSFFFFLFFFSFSFFLKFPPGKEKTNLREELEAQVRANSPSLAGPPSTGSPDRQRGVGHDTEIKRPLFSFQIIQALPISLWSLRCLPAGLCLKPR